MRVPCECGKVLNMADELLGKKVRCPACKTVFVAREAARLRLVPVAGVTAQPTKKQVGNDQLRSSALSPQRGRREHGEEATPRPRKRGNKTSGASGLWIGLGIGGVVLAVALTVVVVLLLIKRDSPASSPLEQKTAQNNPGVPPLRPAGPPDTKPVSKPNTKPPPPAVNVIVAPDELSQLSHVEELAFSQDGRYLATMQFLDPRVTKEGDIHVFQVWDLATGKPLWKLHQGNPDSKQPIFSPDGHYVACPVEPPARSGCLGPQIRQAPAFLCPAPQ